mgnify:CR=1 FL=1
MSSTQLEQATEPKIIMEEYSSTHKEFSISLSFTLKELANGSERQVPINIDTCPLASRRTHTANIQENEANNVEFVKSEEEWNEYKFLNCIDTDDAKSNFMKYGTIYGKKYCVKTDYG